MGCCEYHIVLLVLVVGLAGCGGAREIVMAPPRPAVPLQPDTTARSSRLTLTLVPDTTLPPPFQALTLTLHLLALQQPDGTRHPFLFTQRSLTFTAAPSPPYLLLDAALVPPGRYDTLWIRVSDVSVRFGPNASGSLTVEADSLALPVMLQLAPGRSYTYRLRFELRRSLQPQPNCRWRFEPGFSFETSGGH